MITSKTGLWKRTACRYNSSHHFEEEKHHATRAMDHPDVGRAGAGERSVGYTLSIVGWPPTLTSPAAAQAVTVTIRLDQAANESILSAQALIRITNSAGAAVSGLTITGGTGLGAGMIFSQYQDV